MSDVKLSDAEVDVELMFLRRVCVGGLNMARECDFDYSIHRYEKTLAALDIVLAERRERKEANG